MIRLAFLLNLAVTPLLAAEKPNILFIFTDDQTYKSVSCYDGAWSWCERRISTGSQRRACVFKKYLLRPVVLAKPGDDDERSPASCIGASAHAAQGGGRLAHLAAGVEAGGLSLRLHRQMDLPPKLAGEWDHSLVWHASGDTSGKFDPMHYYSGMRVEIGGRCAACAGWLLDGCFCRTRGRVHPRSKGPAVVPMAVSRRPACTQRAAGSPSRPLR